MWSFIVRIGVVLVGVGLVGMRSVGIGREWAGSFGFI